VRRSLTFGLIFAGASLALRGTPRAAEGSLSLGDAIEEALRAHPGLAAARLGRAVAQAAIDVARQRPNPDLLLEETKETPRDALTLSVPFETAGKRGTRIRLAEAGAATGEGELARTTMELRNDVRRAYYALCAAERRAREAEALQGLAERAREAAKQRFESGDTSRLDFLQAELAASQTANEADGARASVTSARSALNVLLGRSPEASTGTDGDLGAGTVPDLPAAMALADAHSTELAVLDSRIREQSERAALARAQRWPDVGLEGGVTHRAEDFDWGWRAGVSLTLPLFHHHAAEATLEEASLSQLRAQRAAQESSLHGTVVSAEAIASSRRAQYLRYRDEILPRAAEVETMAEDAFRAGQTSLLAMIQTATGIRDLRNKAIEAGVEYQNALADLERAVGAPLP
jgi:cobalt-zinc-cadmium efflux system outer membrane protein